MQNAADSLLNRNAKLIKKLIDEKENAERSSKEKTRFIANASHDLRQPLHALGLYLDSLDNNKSEEDKTIILKKSKQSLKSLDNLFSSLLDISNIDAGAITIAPLHFKLSQLFEEVTDHIKGTANEKGIRLKVEVDNELSAFCDPVLSGRCLRNIAINAIHHSECSEITLIASTEKNNIIISISDNGKGIASENLDLIFEEFQQLDNPHRDRMKGLGLGLTIVKRLLKLQGHKLEVESEVGFGTTFKVSLPYGNSTYISNIRYNANKLKKLRVKKSILVIDDEQQILDGMGLLLNDWQQNVSLAGSIDDAIESVKEGFSPEIIISDYRLQNNTTGADAIRAIKSLINENTQIVFISGETEPQKISEIRNHGYPLIHKPVMGAALRSILSRLHNNPEDGRLIQ
jgi:CheY-like chemotaxis protein